MTVQEIFLQSELRWRSYALPEISSCNRPKDLMRPEQPLAKQLVGFRVIGVAFRALQMLCRIFF